MRTPKRLLPFLIVPAVIGATIFAGVAAAQDSGASGQSDNTPPATTQARPATKIQDVLATLVTDGAITQAQADKVLEALKHAQERPSPRPHFDLGIRNIIGTVATTLGIDSEALLQELQAGATLQEIITTHGSTVDTVAAALVAPVKERLDTLVADGKLTQAQADEQFAKLQENVAKRVENFKQPVKPEAREGRGKGDRPKPGVGRGPATQARPSGDEQSFRRPPFSASPQAPANGTPSTTSGSSL